jgi:hypothetical protein
MEEISEKLLDLGYKKQKLKKPSVDDFSNRGNSADFLRRLTEELGDKEKALSFMKSYHSDILNNYIPEINFEGKAFEMDFFTEKGIVRIEALGEKRPVEEGCAIIVQEVIPYKEISIDDFYTLLIEKNLGINSIIGSGDN